MGWLFPTVMAKMLIREIWVPKTGSDEPVNPEFERLWHIWENQFENIAKISIPHWNQFTSQAKFVELHFFSYALKNEYGAAIYLRGGLEE